MWCLVDVQLSSDDDEESECTIVAECGSHEVSGTKEMTNDDSRTVKMSSSFVVDEESVADLEEWLGQNVIIQYWKGKCESRPSDACRFSNIAVDWFVFVFAVNSSCFLSAFDFI